MITTMAKREKPDFAQVYEQEYSYVYNYVYTQVLHRENAEDLVSDVFMKAMAHYSGFDPAKPHQCLPDKRDHFISDTLFVFPVSFKSFFQNLFLVPDAFCDNRNIHHHYQQ